MRKSNLLPDSTYEKEVERLSGLPKFPALPKAQQELRHALRRISESDGNFIHRLISDIMDTHTICPTPADLIQLAGSKRNRIAKSLGNPDCEKCGGTGWTHFIKVVHPSGVDPYEADFAARCQCRPAVRDL